MTELNVCGNEACEFFSEFFTSNCRSFNVIGVKSCSSYVKPRGEDVKFKPGEWRPVRYSDDDPQSFIHPVTLHSRTCRCDDCEVRRKDKAEIIKQLQEGPGEYEPSEAVKTGTAIHSALEQTIEKDRHPCDECRHDCAECTGYDKFEPKQYLKTSPEEKAHNSPVELPGDGPHIKEWLDQAYVDVCSEFGLDRTEDSSVEKDPDGLQQHEPGARLDDGKMSAQEFDTLLQQWLERIERVLGSKAVEYAQTEDRLFNFRRAAHINNQSMPQALWGMASKHLVSVMDLIEGRLDPTPEIVQEKCTDLVNYIILLSAVLLENNCSENKGE